MSAGQVQLPQGYAELLAELQATVAAAQQRAQRVVNTELLIMYWQLGDAVRSRQDAEGWGTRVIDRLAGDLGAAFPGMRGLSRTNLSYMRAFAGAWTREAIVQQPVGRLPWGHVILLLSKIDDPSTRDWYASAAVEHGWSRAVLTHHVATDLSARSARAPSNFAATLPPAESDLAQALTRDPYVLDFLDAAAPLAERELEDALVTRLQDFLLELGHGFAFVGRQYRITVDGEDYAIDLLFFNWAQSRFVVVELKVGAFTPAHAGQLGFYVAWVEQNLRVPDAHAATVGILLCTTRSENVVRYSLAGSAAPWPSPDTPTTRCPPRFAEPSPPKPSSAQPPPPFSAHETSNRTRRRDPSVPRCPHHLGRNDRGASRGLSDARLCSRLLHSRQRPTSWCCWNALAAPLPPRTNY